ncbi:hypothetical protein FEP96_05453 [Burkholderia multivorans]|nr:hypothetical protein [Burkholderia multivorans]
MPLASEPLTLKSRPVCTLTAFCAVACDAIAVSNPDAKARSPPLFTAAWVATLPCTAASARSPDVCSAALTVALRCALACSVPLFVCPFTLTSRAA